jgi:hypothetical protein
MRLPVFVGPIPYPPYLGGGPPVHIDTYSFSRKFNCIINGVALGEELGCHKKMLEKTPSLYVVVDGIVG